MLGTTTRKRVNLSSGKSATGHGILSVAVHQLELVRHCKGLSRRDVARRMDVDLIEVKHQEKKSTDLRLTELYRWQEALEATLPELLTNQHDPISTPEIDQRRMARMLDLAAEIRKKTRQNRVHRLAQTLLWQLAELSPEMNGSRQYQLRMKGQNHASP